jgi:cellulose synthase/poly-beta-1,6-N-acetylglucosamine synthase-like glycosyltransferase
MIQHEQISNQAPAFSIIIAVYNDWGMLQGCLQSLARQTGGSSFEVIVVDDGSTKPAPEFVRSSSFSYPLVVIRQLHSGISAARNRGVQTSNGVVLLFVDADSRLQANCLAALTSAINNSPQHNCFQLRLVGNCSNLVGRAEELRLITFQQYMLQPDGRIRYLNTAGFAIRRTRANVETGMFDPAALRAEDTLLLADLMQAGELPLFVTDAIVEHYIPLSLAGCFRKDVRSAYLEGRTHDIIASKGVRIRLTYRERLQLLSSMWKTARQQSIGRPAWFVLTFRQTIHRTISLGYKYLRFGTRTHK